MIATPKANETTRRIWQAVERDHRLLASLKSDGDAIRTQKDAVWIEFIPTPGLSLRFYAHPTYWVAGLSLTNFSYDLRIEIGREIANGQLPERWSTNTPDRRGTNQVQRVAEVSGAYDSGEAELSYDSIGFIAEWFLRALKVARSKTITWC